jgi:hypothetical protein
MTLAEAIAQWFKAMARDDSVSQDHAESRALSLALFAAYCGKNPLLDDLAPERLRDFLARWFIENHGSASPGTSHVGSSGRLTEPATLMDGLAEFMDWGARHLAFMAAGQCLAVINELREPLPRALTISRRLADHLAGSGGAFGFPEFLTSFEAGGHSQYDLDTVGESACMEGYFRILRVEGDQVEAEEMLTETRAWPILFPANIAALLETNYIINLELIQAEGGWQIAACGFAYPPGTAI